jgi:hypothetical protein
MTLHTTYFEGGYLPDAPAQNRAEECDDDTRITTTWDEAGNIVDRRPYNDAENATADQLVADEAAPQQVTVDPAAIETLRAQVLKANTVAAVRTALLNVLDTLDPATS